MPALVNSSVGSLPGTSELDGTIVWPRSLEELEERGCGASALLIVLWRMRVDVAHGVDWSFARAECGPDLLAR